MIDQELQFADGGNSDLVPHHRHYHQQRESHSSDMTYSNRASSHDREGSSAADWRLHLEPFNYQVSGHCGVLMLGTHAICKPLDKREHQFYEHLPPSIRSFTPDYLGVIEVRWLADVSGQFRPIGRPLMVTRHGAVPNSSGYTVAGQVEDEGNARVTFCIAHPLNDSVSETDASFDRAFDTASYSSHEPEAEAEHENEDEHSLETSLAQPGCAGSCQSETQCMKRNCRSVPHTFVQETSPIRETDRFTSGHIHPLVSGVAETTRRLAEPHHDSGTALDDDDDAAMLTPTPTPTHARNEQVGINIARSTQTSHGDKALSCSLTDEQRESPPLPTLSRSRPRLMVEPVAEIDQPGRLSPTDRCRCATNPVQTEFHRNSLLTTDPIANTSQSIDNLQRSRLDCGSDSPYNAYNTWTAGINPWAVQQHRRVISRLVGSRSNSNRAVAVDGTVVAVPQTVSDSETNLLSDSVHSQLTNSAETDSGTHTMTEMDAVLHPATRSAVRVDWDFRASDSVGMADTRHSAERDLETPSTSTPTPSERDRDRDDVCVAVSNLSLSKQVSFMSSTGALDRKSTQAQSNDHELFLLLENVTAQFSRPSILDLKMGTRQHGDDAPETKVRRHLAKCQTTTSSLLGVRIGGMQIYQVNSGSYLCRDKYYGRGLSVSGFSRALRDFVHDGFSLRLDVVARVIEKLRELRRHLEQLASYRFYSSSLLILYDERKCCSNGLCANQCPSYAQVVQPAMSCSQHQQVYASVGGATQQSCGDRARPGPGSGSGLGSGFFNTHAGCVCACAHVDVRMIDFAHTTFRGFMHDTQLHDGADHGYIRGLDSLIKEFEAFQSAATVAIATFNHL